MARGRYDGGQLPANAVPGGPSAQVSGYPAGQDAAGGSKRAIRVESPYSPIPPSSWPRQRRRGERHQGEVALVRHLAAELTGAQADGDAATCLAAIR